jgi:tetratricopeptide (TPR) repeat protein
MLDFAMSCYAQAVALDTSHVKSWYMLALVQYRQGDLEAALSSMHRVIEIDRTYSPAWWRTGFWNLEMGHLEDARFAFDVSRKLDPNSLAAAVGLARLHLQELNPTAAIDVLQPFVDAMPTHHQHFGYLNHLLNSAYRRLGQQEPAAEALARARSNVTEPMWDDPWEAEQANFLADINARTMHAEWLASEGRFNESIALANELLREEPNSISLRLLIAGCHREQQRFDLSRAAIADAASRSPEWTSVHVQAAMTALAESESANGADAPALRQEALGHITKALQINPVLPMANGVHGNVLVALDRIEEASKAYMIAAQHDREPTHWLMRAAGSFSQVKQWDKATQVLQRVTAAAPTYGEAWLQLGIAQSHLGDKESAERSLLKARQFRPSDERVEAALRDLHTSGRVRASTINPAP